MAVTIPNTDTAESISWPVLDEATIDRVVVDYDVVSDFLYLFLAEKPIAAVWDLRADNRTYVGLRLVGEDEWTNEAVGIMVEHFRQVTVHAHPQWQRVLSKVEDVRRAALRAMIEDVASMPAIDDSEPSAAGES